jgi:hypothetical protein
MTGARAVEPARRLLERSAHEALGEPEAVA